MWLFYAEIQVVFVLHVFELENAKGLKISLKYVSTKSTSAIASIEYCIPEII
jgi:hypothetical protein